MKTIINKTFDPMGGVLAALLDGILGPRFECEYNDLVICSVASDTMQNEDINCPSNVLIVYDAHGSTIVDPVERERDSDVIYVSWYRLEGDGRFRSINRKHQISYNPVPVGCIVLGANDLKEMVGVYLIGDDFERTRDNIVKARPATMSENRAYKLVDKFKGHTDIVHATKQLYRLAVDTNHQDD